VQGSGCRVEGLESGARRVLNEIAPVSEEALDRSI